jgi:hypothetical protein
MNKPRVYPGDEIKQKASDYHGQCAYARIRPKYSAKSLSIEVPFEEAVKLSLALQSCLLKLNSLDRKVGKNTGVELSITTGTKAIKILDKKVITE